MAERAVDERQLRMGTVTIEWQFDPSQRTRSLSSFESLEHLTWWLLHHGVWHPPQELERIWEAHQEQARDYTLWIVGTRKPWVRILGKRYKPRAEEAQR